MKSCLKMKGDQLQGAETVTSLSIVREGPRIDYRVKMYNPETGGQIDVRNNENMVWNSINLKRVRPVVLPGIRYAVMCVPTPLTLAVDKFSVMDKQAGYYMGKLSVIFTPSLPTIN